MTKARIGKGRFQWNAGAWYGGTIGGISWMVVAALFLAAHEQLNLALIPIMGFVVVLTVSVGLWYRRAYDPPFRSLMILLLLLAFAVPIVWYAIASNAAPSTLSDIGWPQSSWTKLRVSLLVPGLILWLVVLEFSNTKKPT